MHQIYVSVAGLRLGVCPMMFPLPSYIVSGCKDDGDCDTDAGEICSKTTRICELGAKASAVGKLCLMCTYILSPLLALPEP